MDIQDIAKQIKHNCDISDARYWGYYSICGLLMRMRELFQHEHAYMPWDPVSPEMVSRWISNRESLWNELEDREFEDIVIDGRKYNPFDVAGLNDLLGPLGYVYGSGFGTFNKPLFFLGQLKEQREICDYVVYSVGTELCRDLSLDPALLQGRCIYVRLGAVIMILWDRFQTMKSRQCGGLLEEVFSRYGITKDAEPSESLFRSMDRITHAATEFFILHEIGEAFEDDLSEEWLNILAGGCDKYTELYLRGIKDVIADTSKMGPLGHIVKEKDEDLLFLYVSLMDGVRRGLFPDIGHAFQEFRVTKEWRMIEEARQSGAGKASDMRNAVIAYWRETGETTGLQAILRGYTGTKGPGDTTSAAGDA
jgi:hypothetical protein